MTKTKICCPPGFCVSTCSVSWSVCSDISVYHHVSVLALLQLWSFTFSKYDRGPSNRCWGNYSLEKNICRSENKSKQQSPFWESKLWFIFREAKKWLVWTLKNSLRACKTRAADLCSSCSVTLSEHISFGGPVFRPYTFHCCAVAGSNFTSLLQLLTNESIIFLKNTFVCLFDNI